MNSVHYVFNVLDYNTGTWRNCDVDKIANYSGYPVYVYENVSNEEKKVKIFIMNISDRIV